MATNINAIYPQFSLNDWSGVTPVILPFEPRTLSCIGIASAGVAVPFFLFLVAMFYLLVPIWLQNFHSDKYDSNEGGGNPMNCSSNNACNYSPAPVQEQAHIDMMLLRQSDPRRVSALDSTRLGNAVIVGDDGMGSASYFSGGQRGSSMRGIY
jgi:hypothetical protein